VLGYTYPEFFNKQVTQAEIRTIINQLYSTDCMVGPTQATQPKEPKPKDPASPDPIPNLPQPTPKGFGPSGEPKNSGPKSLQPGEILQQLPKEPQAKGVQSVVTSSTPNQTASSKASGIPKAAKFTGPRSGELPWLSKGLSRSSSFPKLSLVSPPGKRTSQAPARSLIHLSTRITDLTNSDGHLREYVANIRVNPKSFGGSFKLYLFDGDVGDESSLLGYKFFMVQPRNSGRGGRRKSARKERSRDVVGSITLTSSLMSRVDRGVLSGMGNEDVKSYLASKMSFKAVKVS
jgi:hypothetical protein